MGVDNLGLNQYRNFPYCKGTEVTYFNNSCQSKTGIKTGPPAISIDDT